MEAEAAGACLLGFLTDKVKNDYEPVDFTDTKIKFHIEVADCHCEYMLQALTNCLIAIIQNMSFKTTSGISFQHKMTIHNSVITTRLEFFFVEQFYNQINCFTLSRGTL